MEHSLSLNAAHAAPAQRLAVAQGGSTLATMRWADLDEPGNIANWDALALNAGEPNPFYESWYLLPSLRVFDPAGEVLVLVMRDGAEMAGLLPIRRERHYYGRRLPHWRGWTHSNIFLGQPLVARGSERAFWRNLLAWADQQGGQELFLHLAQCPARGPLYQALRTELADRPAATVMREERALLTGDATPEDYLEASLAAKKRKELRRQHRRLSEEGELTVERVDDALGVAEWVQEFLALEARGWKGSAGSSLASDARTADLFAEALQGAARYGRLERLALRLDGRAIAMLASFLCAPGACSFKTAFDEDYARYSPGVLLQIENLAQLTRPEIDWVDSCAAQDHPMIDHFWRDRRVVASHSIAIGGSLRRGAFSILSRIETGTAPKGIA